MERDTEEAGRTIRPQYEPDPEWRREGMKVLGKLRVKGEFSKVIGGPRLAVEGVCGPQRQAYLSLPALFRHCWGSQWEARSCYTRGDGFQSPAIKIPVVRSHWQASLSWPPWSQTRKLVVVLKSPFQTQRLLLYDSEGTSGKLCLLLLASNWLFDDIRKHSFLYFIQFQSKWFLIFAKSWDPLRIWWKLWIPKQMHTFSDKLHRHTNILDLRDRLILGSLILLS